MPSNQVLTPDGKIVELETEEQVKEREEAEAAPKKRKSRAKAAHDADDEDDERKVKDAPEIGPKDLPKVPPDAVQANLPPAHDPKENLPRNDTSSFPGRWGVEQVQPVGPLPGDHDAPTGPEPVPPPEYNGAAKEQKAD